MTDHEQPAAGVALKSLIERLDDEVAEASRMTEASPLERFVAEALTSDDAKAKGLVDRVWVVSLPDARKAIAAITEWNTRAPTDAGGAVSEAERRLRLVIGGKQVEEVYRKEGFIYPETTFRGDLRAVLAALTSAPQAEGESRPSDMKDGDASDAEMGRACRKFNIGTPERLAAVMAERSALRPQPLQQGGEVTREQVARTLCRQARLLQGFTASEGYTLEDEVENSFDLFITDADAILALFASPDLGDLAGLVADLEATESSHERRHREDNLVNPDGPDAARALRSLAADRDKAVGLLRDPTAVHINMLRGGIAKLTPEQIGHLYGGDDAMRVVSEVQRQNPDAFPSSQTEGR